MPRYVVVLEEEDHAWLLGLVGEEAMTGSTEYTAKVAEFKAKLSDALTEDEAVERMARLLYLRLTGSTAPLWQQSHSQDVYRDYARAILAALHQEADRG